VNFVASYGSACQQVEQASFIYIAAKCRAVADTYYFSIRAAAIQPRHSLNIYGAHPDITMPSGLAFDVIGGELGLFPNALGPPGFEPGTKGL
jgi:hypothetical protein